VAFQLLVVFLCLRHLGFALKLSLCALCSSSELEDHTGASVAGAFTQRGERADGRGSAADAPEMAPYPRNGNREYHSGVLSARPVFRKLRNAASVGVLPIPKQKKSDSQAPSYVDGQGPARAPRSTDRF